jgi:cytochrome c oxidase accessory protein FixG
VAVCPTGVDIRQGSQLGCIQCGLCIDACDTVMTKIGRPTRLIAYDTDEAIRAREVGQTPTYKPVRARTILYAAIIALVGGAMIYQLATRAFLGMSLIHDRTPLFVTLRDGSIRNAYTVRLINKRSESRQVALTIDGPTSVSMEVQGATATSDWRQIITVDPDTTREIRVLVTIPRTSLQSGTNMIRIKASDLFAGETVTIAENFFAP